MWQVKRKKVLPDLNWDEIGISGPGPKQQIQNTNLKFWIFPTKFAIQGKYSHARLGMK
jgi:hypothetical protein